MPTQASDTVMLPYRFSFLVTMLVAGIVMSVTGLLIIIGSIVLFRPAAILAGVLLGTGGLRLVRRYGPVFMRRQAAFQLDAEGLRYTATAGYLIPWPHVLGLHAVRRGSRVTELYIYLTENPDSALFVGETDPRAAAFGSHRPESPNQLHLRLRNFDTSQIGDVEAAFRAFAPRGGEFPANAKILTGHLARMNWMLLIVLLTLVFGGMAGGMTVALDDWPTGIGVFALFQIPVLLAWASGRAVKRRPGWATPRLITAGGILYLPGTALGSVALDDLLNVRYRLRALVLMFTTSQWAVRNSQYNPYGLFARAAILTTGDTSQELAHYFSDWNIWDNGKKPDIAAAKAARAQRNEDIKKTLAEYEQYKLEHQTSKPDL